MLRSRDTLAVLGRVCCSAALLLAGAAAAQLAAELPEGGTQEPQDAGADESDAGARTDAGAGEQAVGADAAAGEAGASAMGSDDAGADASTPAAQGALLGAAVAETTGVPDAAREPLAPGAAPAPIEVTVTGTAGGKRRLQESAQAVKVVDTTEARRHSADVGEVLARTEGVAIQRTGGLGSPTRLSLHGLTDDQIRVFMDAVPLEMSGFGLGISTVPLAWVEHIEVYRGVVPVQYASDALGGALDLVTRGKTRGAAAGGSLTTGSFDTYQAALTGRIYHPRTHLFSRAALFADTTRNDYLIDVEVSDASGRLRPATVRRFHDGYRALGGMVETGVVDRPWARRLLLKLFATHFDKELQHDAIMDVPYGEVEYGQSAAGGSLRYEQPRLNGSPFGLKLLAAYSGRSLDFRDTSRWVYDWFGQRIFEKQVEQPGELRPFATDLTQWEHRVLSRATLSYQLREGHALRLIAAPDFVTRTGEERIRARPEQLDPATTRRDVFQLVNGLEYELHDRADVVENSAFVKQYVHRPSVDQVHTASNEIQHIERSEQRFGAGDGLRVRVAEGIVAKVSYEYATRLPRADEIFGDGVLTLPSLDLNPETSHNANLGAALERALGARGGTFSAETTGFMRDARDMIARLVARDRVHMYHVNIGSARTLGVDGALRWVSPGRWVALSGNGTWQDQRNTSGSGQFAAFEGQRIPNRPWLFANAAAELRVPRFGADNAELTLAWFMRYVHAFLPGWSDVNTTEDNIGSIPDQLTHSIGAVYTVQGPWTLDFALDLYNLTDAKVFDALGVQRPGRSAFFKVSMRWDRPGAASEEAK